MQLYSFSRSTASFRVRIALALKGLPYHTNPIDLLKGDGEQFSDAYDRINPQHLLPTLVTDDGALLKQSGAICEFLEECYPSPPLLPSTPQHRAYVRALMAVAACDMHPLHTIRVTRYLERQLDVDAPRRKAWVQHWLREGLEALDTLLARAGLAGRYCHGDAVTLADVFVIPQIVSAEANGVSLASLRHLPRIADHCLAHPAFQAALPQNQSDAGPTAVAPTERVRQTEEK